MVRITLKTTLSTIQNSPPGPTRRNGNHLFSCPNTSSKMPTEWHYMRTAGTYPPRAIRNIRLGYSGNQLIPY